MSDSAADRPRSTPRTDAPESSSAPGDGAAPVAETYALQGSCGVRQGYGDPAEREGARPANHPLPLGDVGAFVRSQRAAGQTAWRIVERLVQAGMSEAAAREAVASVPVEAEPSPSVREAIARANRENRPPPVPLMFPQPSGYNENGELDILFGLLILAGAGGAAYYGYSMSVAGGGRGEFIVPIGLFAAGLHRLLLGNSKR